jgi:hypothetical protein
VADWKVAPALEQLRAQLDQLAPDRSRASDGAIGDAAHASRASDHNPWWSLAGQSYVTARDFTHDHEHLDCHALADALVRGRDQRVKYIIWNERILSGGAGRSPWEWRDYTGTNPHTRHLHLSVMADARSLTRIPWLLPGLTAPVAILRLGSRGPAVAELQRVLNAWYPRDLVPPLTVDGIYGPATAAAVRLCQQRSGLVVDGVVGSSTRAVLNL